MADYNKLKKYIIVFLIIYFIGGLSTAALPAWKDKSITPFFSWFLFHKVPNNGQMASVRILEYNGDVFDPPLFFTQAEDVVADPRSQKARQLIHEFLKSIQLKQDKKSEEVRAIFEQNFLPSCIRYEVVALEFNPIERWKSGQYTVKTKKEFTTVCVTK